MLSQFIKKKQQQEPQPGLGSYVHDFFMHGFVHFGALAELFVVETTEYASLLKRHALLLCLGVAAMGLAYLACWGVLVMLLWEHWCGYGALGVLAAFHLGVGVLCMLAAYLTKPGPVAPMTVEELKSDLTCIKLSLNENDKP